MLYSESAKKLGGSGLFFSDDKNAPDDAVEIDDERVREIMASLNVVTYVELSPEEELALAKSAGESKVSSVAQELRRRIAGTADALEVAGWSNKLRIAQAIKAGKASDDDKAAFQAEIDLRGIPGETLKSFAEKAIANAAKFSLAVGIIDGIKRAAQDAIAAAQSQADIDSAIDSMREALTKAFGDAHAI